jgi:hypothetical protein
MEYQILVPSPERDSFGTGIWAMNGRKGQCNLTSIDDVMFIRIKNLQLVKVMITAYNIYSFGGELIRLKANMLQPFVILGRGKLLKSDRPRLPIQFSVPSGNLGGSLVQFPHNDVDLSSSAPLINNLLDYQVGEHYLQPGDTIRGWVFFKYPNTATIPGGLKIKISDDLNHTYDIDMPIEYGNDAGDTLARLMMLGPTVDLSSCVILP